MPDHDNPERILALVATSSDRHNAYLANELAELGVRVLMCRSGDEALTLATEGQPDLLMIETGKSGMNGVEVARRLHNDPATQMIFLFFLMPIKPDYPAFASHFRAGTFSLLTFPYSVGEVKAFIQSWLQFSGRSEKTSSE